MRNVLACSTISYLGHDLNRALEGISRAGFTNVELTSVPGYCEHVMPERLSQKDLNIIVDRMRSLGLAAVGVGAHCDFVGRTVKEGDQGVEVTNRRIDLAEKLGARILITGTLRKLQGDEIDRFFNNAKRIAEHAEDKGVTIVLETVGGLTGTGEDCLKVIDRLGLSNVRIAYDPANIVFYWGIKPEQDIAKIAKHVAYFHLKDNIGGKGSYNFPRLGQGNVNLKAVVDALRKANYAGPFSVEVEYGGKGRTPPLELIDKDLIESFQYAKALLGL